MRNKRHRSYSQTKPGSERQVTFKLCGFGQGSPRGSPFLFCKIEAGMTPTLALVGVVTNATCVKDLAFSLARLHFFWERDHHAVVAAVVVQVNRAPNSIQRLERYREIRQKCAEGECGIPSPCHARAPICLPNKPLPCMTAKGPHQLHASLLAICKH